MDVQVTLTIPHSVFQRVRRAAQREQRSVDQVLSEAVVGAFPAVHAHPQRDQMEAELTAFERQKGALLSEFRSQYVALHGGKVVDHDADKLALATRIDEQYPDKIVLIKLVKAEPDQDLQFRSPRLIR